MRMCSSDVFLLTGILGSTRARYAYLEAFPIVCWVRVLWLATGSERSSIQRARWDRLARSSHLPQAHPPEAAVAFALFVRSASVAQTNTTNQVLPSRLHGAGE